MFKILIIVIAACVFAYYAYWAFSGVYFDVPFIDFL